MVVSIYTIALRIHVTQSIWHESKFRLEYFEASETDCISVYLVRFWFSTSSADFPGRPLQWSCEASGAVWVLLRISNSLLPSLKTLCFVGCVLMDFWSWRMRSIKRHASPRKAAVLVTGFKCFALLATTEPSRYR